MKHLIFSTILSLSFLVSFGQLTSDIKTVAGSMVRVYKVQKGETLYAIARKFDVPPADLMKLNPKADQGLDIGQEIYLPYAESKSSNTDGSVRRHTVKAGETLFSLSQTYQVEVEDIKATNKLKSNALDAGQVLIIPGKGRATSTTNASSTEETTPPAPGEAYRVGPKETLFSISQKLNIPLNDLMEWNNLESSDISVGQMLRVKSPASQTAEANPSDDSQQTAVSEVTENTVENTTETAQTETAPPVKKPEPMSADEFVEVVESGVAELIPDTGNTRKYMALHKTVKPGTILRVRNDMNGREIWARVVGKLPDTVENKDLLVKISKAAYDSLGAVDKKFRVTIKYIP